MRPEWEGRLKHWIATLEKEFYEPLNRLSVKGASTSDMLSLQEAALLDYRPMEAGTPWGRTWEYCWFKSDITLPECANGQRIVFDIRTGGEATVFVNGEAFGTRRAEWVSVPHHYLCDQILTCAGQPGEHFSLCWEGYGGHDFPESPVASCSTGPVRAGDYLPRPLDETRQVVAPSTFGLWHEEAYQLWLDVCTLRDILSKIADTSLRAAHIEEALEQFTLIVDFEQPRENRLDDYAKARAALRPALDASNGSSMPQFYAIGNAHLDVCWLWPYRETERKVARTFAQQLRLMDLYPDYKFLQSQPQTYLICKERYPKLYARIKEKIKTGQWIADGSMWVEPDTNMASGESLIRQLVHGKRFYKDEFDIDTQLLWLPDTFGYSAALPQILKGCGVKYLTTQKIFWTYNGSDRFPYHYFTWQGMDGSEITSFLHMDYTSRTDAATVISRWDERVQKRDITNFLLPFGYGDGGGGPTRDHIEYVLREKDIEGVPQTRFEDPTRFFEDCAEEGAPKNRYVGELYFQCHRGTYTSQAAIKKGNRRSELALREAELWSTAAAVKIPYPQAALDKAWKGVLLNQFHDILPGSSIARVYEEASALYEQILADTANITSTAQLALATNGEGKSVFNSLNWPRTALVPLESGYARAAVPACGWTDVLDESLPESPVRVALTPEGATLTNALITAKINHCGELLSFRLHKNDREYVSGKANVLQLYKDTPRLFDAWDIDSMYALSPVQLRQEGMLEIAEDTPWRCAVKVSRQISGSLFTQVITLDVNSARLDFITHVDWHEKHRLLKAAFPTGIHAEEAINEIQFGYIKRPTHRSRPYDQDRFEVCNHRYTALCDEAHGAAVLNDSKYGVSMLGDEISLTLLRASTSPDLHADQGEHDFTYSFYAWDGPFASCDVVRQGWELNVPALISRGACGTQSLLQVESENIIAEALKLAEDGSGDVILRLYESKHAATSTAIKWNLPFASASECDMLENETQALTAHDQCFTLSFHPFEVKTIRIAAK